MKPCPVSPMVLVVDDDTTTTLVLASLLRKDGFQPVCACDLAGAEVAMRSHSISLVLLDVHLPDGNGLDLCRKWTLTKDIPILFISASDDMDTKVKGFAAGGVDYITKPLAGAEVLARVRTHLRLRAAYDQLVALQAERIQSLGNRQQQLMPLPVDLPQARFQVALRQTQQAGGDFYDVIPLDPQITDYVVADVSGHDIGASLWTAAFKALLSDGATLLNSPLAVCRMINNALRRILPEGAYFTVLYARLDRRANKLTLVNAGHPPAVWVQPKTRAVTVLDQEGDLLGLFPDAVFGVRELDVQHGDRLFMYTDGLIEQGGTRDEGIRRFVDVCRGAMDESLDDAVFYGLASVCVAADMDDDIVLLGVEV